MFLHEDKELFRDVIEAAAEAQKRPIAIVEKDYYVTMILKLLSEKAPGCVFKGGTSLSKCHHAIDRFSEDIDIAFSDALTEGQRKKLKNETIAGISQRLGMPISDWEQTRSRRDYNCYTFDYKPIAGYVQQSLISGVKMEIALGSISFPTLRLPVDSYVYQYLKEENQELVEEFQLQPFEMTLQSLERTFADKVFALCDYYMLKNTQRNSRHIYDLYMLMPKITLDDEYKKLVADIRKDRSKMTVCLSAQPNVNVPEILKEIIEGEIYRSDYEEITTYFQNHPVKYETAISVLYQVIESKIFE